MQSKFKLFAGLSLFITATLILLVSFSVKQVNASNNPEKVGVCHVTGSEKNRYVYIEVSAKAVDGIGGKEDHQSHSHWYDGVEYRDIWGENIKSQADCPDDPPVVIKESHNLTLTSICYDPQLEIRKWRVAHDDSSDMFYPVSLGYKIYNNPLNTIVTPFTYNHTMAARFTDPFYFNTPYNGSSQTVILYWWNSATSSWIKDDTKAANNTLCEPVYEKCSETVQSIGDWSDWMVDPQDTTLEYRTRLIYTLDSQDPTVQCARPKVEKETRYKECSQTYRSYGEWSDWMLDPNDPTQEYREQEVVALDINTQAVCAGPVVVKEYRDVVDEYEQCSYTSEVYGEWSDWTVDPTDESREYIEREVKSYDSEDSEVLCSTDTQKEYRARTLCEWDSATYADDPECIEPEDGDVLGVNTGTGDVLGTTSVVMAQTAAIDSSIVYFVESVLLFITGFSFIYVGSQYLKRD